MGAVVEEAVNSPGLGRRWPVVSGAEALMIKENGLETMPPVY
jgi:hypothetical protein